MYGEPDEMTNLAPDGAISERERLGVRAIALLADKKIYSPSQAMSAMAEDGRLWLGCTIGHVRSGTGALSPYWIVPVASECASGQPVMSRALRSFIGFEGKPRGLYIAYQ